MNRTDRLLAIVLELQGRGRVRAEDLARQLDVSKRTIYRDVLALGEAGVPIVIAPGQGYTLMPGYFLPPLRFSAEEAVTLLLGSDVVGQAFDAGFAGAAGSAARKIGAVLGEEVRREVRFLRDNLRLVQRDPGGEATLAVLRVLRQAIVERRTVGFRYHKPDSVETRQVDPHGLFRLNTVWLLAAFDHRRGAFRNFRLDRIEDLQLLPAHFERQPHFALERDEAREGRDLVVRALFGPAVARLVRQNPPYHMVQTQDTPDGLLVTLRARAAGELLPWLLSWGGQVRVLEPSFVGLRLRAAAQEILSQYPAEPVP